MKTKPTAFLLSLIVSLSQVNPLEACEHFRDYSNSEESQLMSLEETGKTEEKFNLIIDRVGSLYTETVKRLGGDLYMKKKWKSKTLNASANKIIKWKVTMYGGLYRHSSITDDGFALVVCHEIGHLIAGAPFYSDREMSTEGQSDFWGASECLKKYFKSYPESVTTIDQITKQKCDDQFKGSDERSICYRSTMAGISLANYFAKTRIAPIGPALKNPNVLPYTYSKHPEAQCRLDTYIAGSLCNMGDGSASFEEKLLKDKLVSDSHCRDEASGVLSEKRPACWFNKKMNEFSGNWKKTVKSKTIFGLKGGSIEVSFGIHLPGKYKVKLVPQTEEIDQYLKFGSQEFEGEFTKPSSHSTVVFKYKFLKKVQKTFNFQLVIEHNNEAVYQTPVQILAM